MEAEGWGDMTDADSNHAGPLGLQYICHRTRQPIGAAFGRSDLIQLERLVDRNQTVPHGPSEFIDVSSGDSVPKAAAIPWPEILKSQISAAVAARRP